MDKMLIIDKTSLLIVPVSLGNSENYFNTDMATDITHSPD